MPTNIVKITISNKEINRFALVLWFSGCDMNCSGCHNETLKKEQKGYTMKELREILVPRKEITDYCVFMGGEPLRDPRMFLDVARLTKELGFINVLFTGQVDTPPELLLDVDFIKEGGYFQEKRKEGFKLASSNQVLSRVDQGVKTAIYYVENDMVVGKYQI